MKKRALRPFQENKSPKNGQFSEEKASGLGGFNFWNYLILRVLGIATLFGLGFWILDSIYHWRFLSTGAQTLWDALILEVPPHALFVRLMIMIFCWISGLWTARYLIQQKRTETKLRESEARYHAIFEGVQDAIFVERVNGEVVDVNARACEMYGYPYEELITKSVGDLVPSEHWPSDAPSNWRVPDHPVESVNIRANGERFPVEVTGQMQIIGDEEEVLLVVVRDITRHRRAKRALAQERDLLHALMENLPDLIYFKDTDSRFTRINRAEARVLGVEKPQDAVGKTDFDYFTLEHAQDAFQDERRIVETGEPLIDKLEKIQYADGAFRWVTSTKVPIKDENGEVVGLVGVSRDVNERVRAEARIQRLLEQQLAVHQLAIAMGNTLDLDAIYQTIYDHISDLMDVSAFLISFYDRDQNMIHAEFMMHNEAPFDVRKLPLIPLAKAGQGNQSRVIRTGEPLYIADWRKSRQQEGKEYTVMDQGGVEEGAPPPDVKEQSTNSAILAPLKIGGDTIGVIQVQSCQLDAFTAEDLDLLEAIGNVASISIQNARLYESLQQELRERRRAEAALRDSEAWLRHVLDSVPHMIFAKDIQGRYVMANRAAAEAHGITPRELIGRSYAELAGGTEEEREQYLAEDQEVIETQKQLFITEETFTYPDGEVAILQTIKLPVTVPSTGERAALGVSIDITERKQAEAALRESEARYRMLFEQADDAIFLERISDSQIVDVNPRACEMLGYTREELLSMTVDEIKAPHDLADTSADESIIEQELATYGSRPFEAWGVRKDGSLVSVEVSLSRIDHQGEALVLSIVRDITERKQAEEERQHLLEKVQAQARRTRQLMETVPEGVLMLSPDLTIELANPTAEKFLAFLAEKEVGQMLSRLGERPIKDLLTSPPTRGLWHEIKYEGRIFEVIARPVEKKTGAENWVMVIQDVTQAREIQRRGRQQERLAAVGQLTAGIAHDFNNIMATIVLYAQMASRSDRLSQADRERMTTINQQARHATQLIQQILDFSRRSALERIPLDLLPFFKEQVKLLERTLPEHITIKLDYGKEDYTIQADPTRIQQMIMNLAINARDAMSHGGVLTFTLSRIHVSREELAPMPMMETGSWVRIAIADTGEGIPPDVLPHIFEPFYTTKAPLGNGLGLAQVQSIVEQHEWHIDVETEVGVGTTFLLYLPALPDAETEKDTISLPALTMGGGETILVVEDNATARVALQESLRMLLYEVIVANHGKEALEILAQRGEEIDLVLSDVVMPEMGGLALLRTMQAQNIEIPVILLTGHPLEKDLNGLEVDNLHTWMTKPPDLEKLASVIAQALKRPQ